MTRTSGIAVLLCLPFALLAQGGDKELRANADALFAKGEYAAAFQPYQTLVGNNQQDFDLNFRYGVCALHGGADKDEAIKYLKRSTLGANPPALAWYFLGKAYHTSYQFKDALVAYERYRGTADKKMLAERPVDALELQCRNGQHLLSNLKEIAVHNKVEVDGADFFRFYDLSSIGGKIVVTPEDLKSAADKKSKSLSLVYLPDKPGPIYFASYGKAGTTGRDIYRTHVLPNGEFATPVKLAGYINTDQDDDFPFMAPDGKSFYFCSKGHNSMGGYDVFRSTYDQGLDVFGAPENLDFAVNTPDDELLYLTDPEGKEACFASGRNSKQGTVHVYRVSTAQAPVNITVLKGTFASQLDADDRKARITVQDALTQETVATVATDVNGNYVLSLPRSGKYRFMVEAGPGAKTHMGVVDVPRNDEPRAYRQEMSLVDQGGEKLMIRNYFDQPLEEDMIALALDEIKRRAKLDVGTPSVVADEKPKEEPSTDPITRAGFSGDVGRTDAQRMADEDAAALRKATDELEHQSVAAYSIALENADLAEGYTARAEALVAQAKAEPDEKRKNDLMVEAARQRQSARAANQRATAALRAGETLAAERMATQIRAQKAEKLSTDLTRVMAGKDDNAMVIKLVELRTRMDEKNAPDGSLSAAEKMRRMATEREKEAAAAMQRANSARGEENELVDRIARKQREETDAKGSKKETLARERTELEAQLQAMRDENERAFIRARLAEQETGHARGQAALAKHLSMAAEGMAVNELDENQKSQLAQRVSGTGTRIAAIALDERYDAAIAMESREIERRTYDWGAPIAVGSGEALATTRRPERDSTASAQGAQPTSTMVTNPDLAAGKVRSAGDVEAPGTMPPSDTGATAADAATGKVDTSGTVAGQSTAERDNPTPSGGTQEADTPATGSRDSGTAVAVSPVSDIAREGQEPVGTSRTDTDLASMKGVTTQAPEPTTPAKEAGAEGSRTVPVAKNTGGEEDGALTEEITEAAVPPSADELAFVQANELAELKQLRTVEKNRVRKDSLDQRITALERSMREGTQAGTRDMTAQQVEQTPGTGTQQAGTEEGTTPSTTAQQPGGTTRAADGGSATAMTQDGDATRGDTARPAGAGGDTRIAGGNADSTAGSREGQSTDNTTGSGAETRTSTDADLAPRPAFLFSPSISDSDLIANVYPDYAARKALMERELDDPKERGAALHGLELMLMDSIDAENTRQLDLLEQQPATTADVLERVDRLRRLKEEHLRESERVLAAADQAYAAGESRAMEDAALAAEAPGNVRDSGPIAASATPHNDQYVHISTDREQVYASAMDHRAKKVGEAVRERDRDMSLLTGMEDRIDSLEQVLESMPMGKEHVKLRDRTDKLIDDHMILRTEIGQRMGYITRQEFTVAQDSSKALVALNAKQGLSPNEPLVLLARSFEDKAKQDMEQAQALRKRADRSEDIVLRDSLFRTAYAQELQALRSMDRSHTVRNHLQSDTYVKGERLSYEEVERRLFSKPTVPVMAAVPAEKGAAAADADSSGLAVAAPVRVEGNDAAGSARYTEFMAGDAQVTPTTDVRGNDVSSLRSEAQRAAERSQALEQASVAAADRASALQDSAASAKRAERTRLEREALRSRAISDSLHQASVRSSEMASELERRAALEQETAEFRERLLKYYYLNGQEQAMVLNEEDRSRYFQARAKALDQREQGTRAREQAASNKQLADALLQESKEILQNGNAGGAPLTQEQMERARLLTDQAVRLNQRSDSLARVSERMNMAAGVNESQAASMLQAFTPERGTEIMAMEQRARRVEPVLAEARSLQQGGTASLPARAVTDVATVNDAVPADTVVKPGSVAGQLPDAGQPAQPLPTTATAATDVSPDRTARPDPRAVIAAPELPAVDAPVADRPRADPPEAGTPRLLAPLTADLFEINTAVAPRTGPIPIDQPMPAGVVYKVQIGAFKQDIPDDLFQDMTPVTGESVGNGLTRYAVGMFTTPEGAVKATQTVRERGYRDAFVVAYQDGRRVSLSQAMRAARPAAASTAVTADLPTTAPARISTPVPMTATATPSDSALAAEQEVLAKYPASVEQVLAQFAPPPDATTYYNDPNAAPARQVETVKGLFYTVQVGVYSKPTALDKLFNITPLNSERTENAKIRYTTGVFVDMEKARSRKDETVGLGVKDAFITAYLNGKRIPMRDARALITKFGAGVFADPALITR